MIAMLIIIFYSIFAFAFVIITAYIKKLMAKKNNYILDSDEAESIVVMSIIWPLTLMVIICIFFFRLFIGLINKVLN